MLLWYEPYVTNDKCVKLVGLLLIQREIHKGLDDSKVSFMMTYSLPLVLRLRAFLMMVGLANERNNAGTLFGFGQIMTGIELNTGTHHTVSHIQLASFNHGGGSDSKCM